MLKRIVVHLSVFGLILALTGVVLAQQQQQQPQQQPQDQQQLDQQRQQQQQQQRQVDQQRQQDPQWQRQERILRQPQDPDLQRTAPHVGEAPHVVSGTITDIREADFMGQRHLNVGVETFDRQRTTIDLGPARQAQPIRELLQQGERITVTGGQTMLDNRPVFVADHIRVAGERFDLDPRALEVRFQQDPQLRGRIEQARLDRERLDRQRTTITDRDRMDRSDRTAVTDRDRFERTTVTDRDRLGRTAVTDRDTWQRQRGQQARTISGTITQFRETDHLGERHLHVRVRTTDDQTMTVDLGPVQEVREIRNVLEEGERSTVAGRQLTLDGRQVFVAEQARLGGQRFDLDQWPQQARFQQDSQRDRAVSDRELRQQDHMRTDGEFREQDRQARGVQPRSQQRTPEGYVLVSERVVVLLTDQLNRHFINARTQLQQENFDRAAAETRLAAEFLDMYAGIAEGDVQSELESVQNELRDLSEEIEDGQVTQRRELDRKFARAHRALAKYNVQQARELQDEDQSVAAGYRIRAAARHLQQAVAFADAQVDQDATRVFQEAQQAGARMIRGQDAQTDQDQLIEKMERQIDRLDDEFN